MLDHHDLKSTEVADARPPYVFGRVPPYTRKAIADAVPDLRYRISRVADVGAPHSGKVADPEPSIPNFVLTVAEQDI